MIRHAELISTGAELLSGRSVNTHAQQLGIALRRLGIHLDRDTTVPDDFAVMEESIRSALGRVDLVFVSGGLGPTNDDITRDVVAKIAGRNVVMSEVALAELTERMQRYGREMNPSRQRQALVVEGAEVYINKVGAAPGERLDLAAGKVLFLLPGPPPEFRYILQTYIEPYLIERQGGAAAVRERILLTQGIGEADIMQRFLAAGFPPQGIETAYCAAAGRVEVRLNPADDISEEALDQAAAEAARLMDPFVYAHERIEIEDLIGRALTAQGKTLATAESCTGGLIGQRITAVPGSSAYYRGGIIAYADAVKTALLGVDPVLIAAAGAVSESVAAAMAKGVCAQLQADYGLAVTGIAGPGGGTENKPVGWVCIALAGPGGVEVQEFRYFGDRETVREATCRSALMLLYHALQ